MNRRALWIAIEWRLLRCPKIGRTMTKSLKSYGINLSWLIGGDIEDLQQMMQQRRMGAPTLQRLREKLSRLSESELALVDKRTNELLEDQPT